MLTDPLAQQIIGGGLVGVLMLTAVLKFLPAFMTALRAQKNGNGNGNGHMSRADYELMLGRVMREANREVVEKLQELNENIDRTRENLQRDVTGHILVLDQSLRRIETLSGATLQIVQRQKP